MITLLSLLLLAQLFAPAQEQVASAAIPPVEVLDVEVRTYEVKPRMIRETRETAPIGPTINTDVNKGRAATISGQRNRSRELTRIGTGTSPQPVPGRSPGGYSYEYRARIKNVSPKKIKSILWEYQLTDSSGATIVSQRLFLCAMTVKSGSDKLLRVVTPSPPNRVVSADTSEEQSQKQRAVINGIKYSDGSTWFREEWKPDDLTRDAITKQRDLRDGQCTPL